MEFDTILKGRPDPVVSVAGKLRTLVLRLFDDIDEKVFSGKKVQLVLYSIGKRSNVLCGIQTNEKYCLFYVHHAQKVDTGQLQLEGRGNHTKHIKYATPDELNQDLPQLELVLHTIYDIISPD